MELKGKKIVFLGDSITEGAGTSGEKATFVYQVGKAGGFRESKNYGISGTRIARQTYGSPVPVMDMDFCSRINMLDEDADIVVVFGGSNDYGHGDARIGDFDSRELTTFYGACHYLMFKLIGRYPGKPIVIVTPMHRDNERDPKPGIPEEGVTLQTYVNILREVAEYYSLPVLDLFAESGLQPAVPAIHDRYMPDGLHPNDAGHALLTEKFLAFLMNL